MFSSELFCGCFYGALTVFTVGVSRRCSTLLIASLILTSIFLVSTLSYIFLNPHMKIYPITDFVAILLFLSLWAETRRTWTLLLVSMFVEDAFIHNWYFSQTYTSFALRYQYDLLLNLVYIAQLLCVITPSLRMRQHE